MGLWSSLREESQIADFRSQKFRNLRFENPEGSAALARPHHSVAVCLLNNGLLSNSSLHQLQRSTPRGYGRIETAKKRRAGLRKWIAGAFTAAEDVIYIGLGCLLAASGLTFLFTEMFQFSHLLVSGKLSESIVPLLDRLLLIVIIVEILLP